MIDLNEAWLRDNIWPRPNVLSIRVAGGATVYNKVRNQIIHRVQPVQLLLQRGLIK